jgi:phage baseplate assembly protein W
MTPDQYDKEFIGQGLAFPLQINPRGELALVKGMTDIEQSIRIILETAPGERVMRPEFGCRIHELLFDPQDNATSGLIVEYVKDALGRWEPRIEVDEVTVDRDPNQDGTLLVYINYRVKDTHDQRSIVYPFYLTGEEE